MKNSIKISVATLAFASVFTFSGKAQESEPLKTTTPSTFRLSIGPDVVLPIGQFSDRYKWGVGGSLQAEYPILSEKLFVTLNAGYLNFFKNDEYTGINKSDLSLVPVKAGLKYFPVKNFYLQGEAGASFLTNKGDVGATKSTTFIYAPQVGYQFPVGEKNYIDAGVRFEGNTKFYDDGKSNNFFGLRVAYSFGL